MSSLNSILQYAVQGMETQSRRLEVTAENISNADTPGYQRKLLTAEVAPTTGDAFRQFRVTLDDTLGDREFDPTHPMADGEGFVTMSNVSVVTEMADMREANRTYEANLNAFQNARTMYRSLIDVLRR